MDGSPKAGNVISKSGESGGASRSRAALSVRNHFPLRPKLLLRAIFKDFRCACIILAGIELMHMIGKGQMHDDGFAKTAVERFNSLIT